MNRVSGSSLVHGCWRSSTPTKILSAAERDKLKELRKSTTVAN